MKDLEQIDTVFKKRLLVMMESCQRFFEQHGIKYYGGYGTVLGAVRHGGFIPWDDDLDLHMMREDYNRLIELNGELEKTGYRFVCIENDDTCYYPFGKIIDLSTSLWEFAKFPYMSGVYIDVFPLDNVAGTKDEYEQKRKAFQDLHRKHCLALEKPRIRRFIRDCIYWDFPDGLNRLRYYDRKVREKEHNLYYRRLIASIESFRNPDGDYCTYFPEGPFFKKDWFLDPQELTFEGIRIPVPGDYDTYLTLLYGDYMTPPPPEKRNLTHGHARQYLNLHQRVTIEQARKDIKKGRRIIC